MDATEPAFDAPLHVGRPNIGDRDRLHVLIDEVLDRQWLTNDGVLVRELEARLAAYSGVEHCVAVTNGTIALEIAIRALGLSGEVIVPAFTFVATAHALSWQGITPVFVDIDPVTHCIDPEAVRRAITPQTTGIVAVHLWGGTANVAALEAIAEEHDLRLLFDAAHAFGSYEGESRVGSAGDAEVLSLHATKFFNSVEGGAILTNDGNLAQTARLMRNFGFAGEDTVVSVGTNGKLSEFPAAMGLVNLDAIDEVLAVNRRNFTAYRDVAAGLRGFSILETEQSGRSNLQYVVGLVTHDASASRDEVLDTLRRNNVLARRYFWPGCHRMEPYRTQYPDAGAGLPQTELIAEQVLVLPTGKAVSEDAIRVIGSILDSALSGR